MWKFAWRQHRAQLLLTAIPVLLIGLYALFVPPTQNQTNLDFVRALMALPLIIGVFWGAPLFSKEFEDGTTSLVLLQGISLKRWFGVKLGLLLIIAAVYGALASIIASSWLPVHPSHFHPAQFGITGIIPIFYAIAAVSVGAFLGAWRKRVLPAMALTLVIFIALQYSIATYVRPHYQAPLPFRYQTSSCQTTYFPGTTRIQSHSCKFVQNKAYKDYNTPGNWDTSFEPYTYQPAHRYWKFQAIEAAIYSAFSATLILATYRLILRGDK